MENKKVIIVGAGMAGLSAGFWLQQRGYDVEILEVSDRPGGRTIILEHGEDKVDIGAQFYHSNFRHAFELMDAVNLTSTQRVFSGNIKMGFADGSTQTYDPRVPYMKSLGLSGNLGMYWFVLKHVILGGHATSYLITKDRPEYDNIGVLDAFKSRFGKPLKEHFVPMISKSSVGVLPEFMSFYHFVSMVSHFMLAKYIYLTGGTASLAYELAKHMRVQYEAPARRVVMEKGRAVGVEMEGDGSVKKAGHVIVATTHNVAATLMPEELEEQRSFFASIPYVHFPMPIFFLDRPLDKSTWCYYNDPRLNRTYAYGIDQLVKAPAMIKSGKSVLVPFGVYPMTLDMLDKPDDVVIKTALEDFEISVPGISNWVEDAVVYQHKFVDAIYPPGSFRAILDFVEEAKKLRGVSFASSLFGGECMEAAMASGREAVKRVCGWGGIVHG